MGDKNGRNQSNISTMRNHGGKWMGKKNGEKNHLTERFRQCAEAHLRFKGLGQMTKPVTPQVLKEHLNRPIIRVHRQAKFAQSTILCFQYLE